MYRCNTAVGGFKPGDVVTSEQLQGCDLDWLVKSGAVTDMGAVASSTEIVDAVREALSGHAKPDEPDIAATVNRIVAEANQMAVLLTEAVDTQIPALQNEIASLKDEVADLKAQLAEEKKWRVTDGELDAREIAFLRTQGKAAMEKMAKEKLSEDFLKDGPDRETIIEALVKLRKENGEARYLPS